jgi:hypothetical protein
VTEDELKSIVEAEESQALGYSYGDLQREREKALRYYNGEVDVVAPDGRSDVVSTDVRDGVDGMLPDLLDIFLSSDQVVVFDPNGPEDEEACRQATDACNYIFYKQNNGALIMYEWFKTALLEKNGVVKYWWEESEKKTKETYRGLNRLQLDELLNQPNTKLIQGVSYPDPSAPPMDPMAAQTAQAMGQPLEVPSLYDVTVEVMNEKGKVCIKGVPPEEFLVSNKHNSVSLQDAPFVAHRCKLTASALKETFGIKQEDLEGLGAASDPAEFSAEWQARRRLTEEQDYQLNDNSDPARKEYWTCEAYLRVDFDGDGYTELRKIVKVGSKIFLNEETDHIPFAAICPVIMPYRFYGLSIADLVADIQKLKSVIWRQMLDSLYLANNPRIGVMESMVNLDDLLVSRPGGVVRFKTNPSMAWAPLETRFVGQQAFPMVEYMDSVKENRTGFSRYSQGSDADSLNKTATGISLITQAAGKRMKLIARMFAETGVKDLFRGILHMVSSYNTKPMMLRLRNKWVNMDPRMWKTEWDSSINVGLGTGDKTQELSSLMNILALQKEFLMSGKGHMVTDQNLYNSAFRAQEKSGFKNEGEFFTPPDPNNPPQQPPNPEMIKIEADMKKEGEKIASEERKKAAEIQSAQQLAELQAQTQVAIAKIKEQGAIEREAIKAQQEAELEVFRTGHQKDLEVYKTEKQEKLETMKVGADFQKNERQLEAKKEEADEKSKVQMAGKDRPGEVLKKLVENQAELTKQMAEVAKALAKPKKIVRDPKTREIVGTE